MVDVAHNGNHRRTTLKFIIVTGIHTEFEIERFEQFSILILRTDHLDLEVHLVTEELQDIV